MRRDALTVMTGIHFCKKGLEMIIDIHTHMLYGIDDGVADMKESLKLMERAYEQGVRGIFLTNHSYGMERKYESYHRRFDKLKAAASEHFPGLELYKGCEVLCFRDEMEEIICGIKDGKYPTLNGTRYVLMEFSPHSTKGMAEMMYCLEYALDAGYVPVVAHVERYDKLYKHALNDLEALKKLGCLFQINLYSVEQDQGHVSGGSRKVLANLFLQNGLVDFVGTDSHNMYYKAPEAAVGAAAIRERYGDELADRVLYKNAEKMLRVK